LDRPSPNNLYENRKSSNNVDWLLCHVFPLVPKLQLGNALPGKLQLPSCYS
jgi:hypothetical protein